MVELWTGCALLAVTAHLISGSGLRCSRYLCRLSSIFSHHPFFSFPWPMFCAICSGRLTFVLPHHRARLPCLLVSKTVAVSRLGTLPYSVQNSLETFQFFTFRYKQKSKDHQTTDRTCNMTKIKTNRKDTQGKQRHRVEEK